MAMRGLICIYNTKPLSHSTKPLNSANEFHTHYSAKLEPSCLFFPLLQQYSTGDGSQAPKAFSSSSWISLRRPHFGVPENTWIRDFHEVVVL